MSLPSRLSSSSLTECEGSFFSFVSLCSCTITLCLTWDLLTSGLRQPSCRQSGTLLKDSSAISLLKPTGHNVYPPSAMLYFFVPTDEKLFVSFTLLQYYNVKILIYTYNIYNVSSTQNSTFSHSTTNLYCLHPFLVCEKRKRVFKPF